MVHPHMFSLPALKSESSIIVRQIGKELRTATKCLANVFVMVKTIYFEVINR